MLQVYINGVLPKHAIDVLDMFVGLFCGIVELSWHYKTHIMAPVITQIPPRYKFLTKL